MKLIRVELHNRIIEYLFSDLSDLDIDIKIKYIYEYFYDNNLIVKLTVTEITKEEFQLILKLEIVTKEDNLDLLKDYEI